MTEKLLLVTQTKSSIGRPVKHQACLKGLGLRRIHETVKVKGSVENLGMINKVSYMLTVEEI